MGRNCLELLLPEGDPYMPRGAEFAAIAGERLDLLPELMGAQRQRELRAIAALEPQIAEIDPLDCAPIAPFSTRLTLSPRLARNKALQQPIMPPPTIATSLLRFGMAR